MALESTIARRYALALSELAGDQAEAVQVQLEAVLRQFHVEDGLLLNVMANPAFTAAEQRAILDAVLSRMSLDPLVRCFLTFMLERRRFVFLPQLVDASRDILDEQLGQLRAQVRTAREPSPGLRQELQTALRESTGKPVEITFETDPDLLAGMVVQVGDLVYDSSLRARLETMRRSLLNTHNS